MLEERRSSIVQLLKKREDLVAKVAELDRQIVAAGGSVDGAVGGSAGAGPARRAGRGRPPGSGNRTAGGRVRNAASLGDTIASAMEGKGPMSVGDILAAVEATGYSSSSANFRGIVNQTLIKDDRFEQASRGSYVMK